MSRWPHICLWAYDHIFVCEQITTLLSVSRLSHFCWFGKWPHFCLCGRWPQLFLWCRWAHIFLCVQITTFLSLSREPHFYICSDDFICVQMTTILFVWQVSRIVIKIFYFWLPEYIPQRALGLWNWWCGVVATNYGASFLWAIGVLVGVLWMDSRTLTRQRCGRDIDTRGSLLDGLLYYTIELLGVLHPLQRYNVVH